MDLALGVAYAGYHLWKHRQKMSIDFSPPYVLDIPPELRLLIYEFVFDSPEEAESPSQFLEPLLTSRLIYQEAYPLAFQRANFILLVKFSSPPFWTPQILTLPASKLKFVRKVSIMWDSTLLELADLRKIFAELAHGPLKLSTLTFIIRNPHTLAPFRFKYALLFPYVSGFGRFIMEELPVLENVDKIVIPSPGVELKRTFQHLFDPAKPRVIMGPGPPVGPGGRRLSAVQQVKKELGKWKYTIVREGTDVRDWRLELTHPEEVDEALPPESEAVEG